MVPSVEESNTRASHAWFQKRQRAWENRPRQRLQSLGPPLITSMSSLALVSESIAAEQKPQSTEVTKKSSFGEADSLTSSTKTTFGPSKGAPSTTDASWSVGSSGFGTSSKTTFGSTPSSFGSSDNKTAEKSSSPVPSTTTAPIFGSSFGAPAVLGQSAGVPSSTASFASLSKNSGGFAASSKTTFGSTPSSFGSSDNKTAEKSESSVPSTTTAPIFGSSFGAPAVLGQSAGAPSSTASFASLSKNSGGFAASSKTTFGSTPSSFGSSDNKTAEKSESSVPSTTTAPIFGSSFGAPAVLGQSAGAPSSTASFASLSKNSGGFAASSKTTFGSTSSSFGSSDNKTAEKSESSVPSTTTAPIFGSSFGAPSVLGQPAGAPSSTASFASLSKNSGGFGTSSKTTFGSTPSSFGSSDNKTAEKSESSVPSASTTTAPIFGSSFGAPVVLGQPAGVPSSTASFASLSKNSGGFGTSSKTTFGSTPFSFGSGSSGDQTTLQGDCTKEEGGSYRERLVAFYSKHKPTKVDTVDTLLTKYAGKEKELLLKLQAKYESGDFLEPSGSGPVCYMEFEGYGKVTVQLFADKAPHAAENFRALCTGEKGSTPTGTRLHYKGSYVHRVVPNFCVQAGDFTVGDGTGGKSIYSPGLEFTDMWGNFADEKPFLKHAKKGLLSMANNGPNRNGSQWFFTLKPLRHLDGKHVVFGEIIDGMDVIEQIGSLSTDKSQCPRTKVKIADCGEVKETVTTANANEDDGGCENPLTAQVGDKIPPDTNPERASGEKPGVSPPTTRSTPEGEGSALVKGVSQDGPDSVDDKKSRVLPPIVRDTSETEGVPSSPQIANSSQTQVSAVEDQTTTAPSSPPPSKEGIGRQLNSAVESEELGARECGREARSSSDTQQPGYDDLAEPKLKLSPSNISDNQKHSPVILKTENPTNRAGASDSDHVSLADPRTCAERAFDLFDTKKQGYLSVRCFHDVVEEAGEFFSPSQLRNEIRAIDPTNSGRFTREGFDTWYSILSGAEIPIEPKDLKKPPTSSFTFGSSKGQDTKTKSFAFSGDERGALDNPFLRPRASNAEQMDRGQEGSNLYEAAMNMGFVPSVSYGDIFETKSSYDDSSYESDGEDHLDVEHEERVKFARECFRELSNGGDGTNLDEDCIASSDFAQVLHKVGMTTDDSSELARIIALLDPEDTGRIFINDFSDWHIEALIATRTDSVATDPGESQLSTPDKLPVVSMGETFRIAEDETPTPPVFGSHSAKTGNPFSFSAIPESPEKTEQKGGLFVFGAENPGVENSLSPESHEEDKPKPSSRLVTKSEPAPIESNESPGTIDQGTSQDPAPFVFGTKSDEGNASLDRDRLGLGFRFGDPQFGEDEHFKPGGKKNPFLRTPFTTTPSSTETNNSFTFGAANNDKSPFTFGATNTDNSPFTFGQTPASPKTRKANHSFSK